MNTTVIDRKACKTFFLERNKKDEEKSMEQFPTLETEDLRIAGSLIYQPRARFDERLMDVLQQILERAYGINRCENPKVILDWSTIARKPDSRVTHRSTILLYQDEADWAEEQDGHYTGIGLLFCRRDFDRTSPSRNPVTYLVHLPIPEWQDKLLSYCDILLDTLKQGNSDPLNAIGAYLSSRLNEPTAWKPLNLLLSELGVFPIPFEL